MRCWRQTGALPVAMLLVLAGDGAFAEVKVRRGSDQSLAVQTSAYGARIDADGNLAELKVHGVRALAHPFGPPGKPPAPAPTINVDGRAVAVRSGDFRVEYTFEEKRIKVVTQGYFFQCQLDRGSGKEDPGGVKAVVVPGGRGGALGDRNYPGSRAIVLTNGRTAAHSIPFHASDDGHLFPTCYVNGSGVKPGDRLEFEWKLGDLADAVELLSGITITPVGNDDRSLKEGGNQGYGLIHFPRRDKITFESSQQNLSGQSFDLEYRLSVVNHHTAGAEVAKPLKELRLQADARGSARWDLPDLPPGFYYLTVSVWRGKQKLTDSRQTFAVDLPRYAPPDTTPADFKAFWTRQDQRLREAAAEPVLTRISSAGNPNQVHELTLDMPGGRKLRGYLSVPAVPGDGPAILNGWLKSTLDEMFEKAKAPEFKPASEAVTLWVELPEDATYKRWDGAEDNNLLECILCYVRGLDYLAGRPDVDPKRILVVGSSRSGPLAVITAALRPRNVCGVDAHMHTSAGLSWTDKPYRGWGTPSWYDPRQPETVRRLSAMAAYVDPVNHAPFVHAPAIFAYGIDDDLSPPQGIEAMYQRTASKWKRISRDAGGHQYSNGFQALQKDLAQLLGSGTAADPGRERILTNH